MSFKCYAWYVRGQKHAKLAEVSMAAVCRVDRYAELLVATDDPEVTVPGARMVRFEPGLPLMLANIEAQLQVMWCRSLTQIVFLDTDVLFLKPFPDQLDEALVVTWRDTVGGTIKDIKGGVADVMPYNYGVMSVVPGLRTLEAFTWMRERVRRMAPGLQLWWGNQIALSSLCGPRPEGVDEIGMRAIPWLLYEAGMQVKVRKLAGDTWNYTPRDEHEDLSERGAVHFKGHTREWMKTCALRLELPWLEEAV
jgi:hypothetical protein